MKYVALLRGINVGGKGRVEMARLIECFDRLGYTDIKTYINSGNVIFSDHSSATSKMEKTLEDELEREFGWRIPIIVRTDKSIKQLNDTIPTNWINNNQQKTDVMFLWQDYDDPRLPEKFVINPDHENLLYIDGALIWNIDRKYITKSKVLKMVGTDLYKNLTVRNINTVRKLNELMSSL